MLVHVYMLVKRVLDCVTWREATLYPFGRLKECSYEGAALEGRMSRYSLQESMEAVRSFSKCC